ncbi:MAG: site-2 protease family protein [Cytophagaceae bacterium]
MLKGKNKSRAIQIALFLATLLSTTLTGAFHQSGDPFNFSNLPSGLYFSLSFLAILTIHEFGHYLTARYYKANVSLPYFIPFIPVVLGTMGAFIRIKSRLRSKKEIFDIGIAGPLAGFVAALIILYYGFTHLPPAEYIYNYHPEYQQYGLDYPMYVYKDAERIQASLKIGDNLIFLFFKNFVVSDPSRIPTDYEMMHYPFLWAGYFALFFTALNLLPIGQLDGGHILYGLVGARLQRKISPVIFAMFVYIGGLGVFTMPTIYEDFIPVHSMDNFLIFTVVYLGFLYIVFSRVSIRPLNNFLIALAVFSAQLVTGLLFPDVKGFLGWLIFAAIIGKFIGIYHPPAEIEEELDTKRKVLGWISFVVFILCFTPNPIE